jgi:hypothetical protein
MTFCYFFLAGFVGWAAPNKDNTVWLDRARLAHTCIPSSFMGMPRIAVWCTPNPKNTFARIKFNLFWQKLLFIL